jgi:hypothetical protein
VSKKLPLTSSAETRSVCWPVENPAEKLVRAITSLNAVARERRSRNMGYEKLVSLLSLRVLPG